MTKLIFTLTVLLLVNLAAKAQWSQDWIDNFDGTSLNTSNWNAQDLEPRAVNGEAQKYIQLNDLASTGTLTLANGVMKITAKRNTTYKDANGNPYPIISARINSQGKKEFGYGRVESRIYLPANAPGLWPAFWQLGSNINNVGVGWPACGEMDILEYVGASPQKVYSTTHCTNHHGGAGIGGTLYPVNCESSWHTYAVEYYPDRMAYFYDDNNFFTQMRPDNASLSEYPWQGQTNFILLNFAISDAATNTSMGGWTGIIPNSWQSSDMLVDYVKHSQSQFTVPGRIEAENMTNRSDNQKSEACSDTGGGRDLGYFNVNNSWVTYRISVATAGTYDVKLRVASVGGGTLQIEKAGGGTVYKSGIVVPNTGGWQQWQDLVVPGLPLEAGTYEIALVNKGGGYNINWFDVYSSSPVIYKKYEAESYTSKTATPQAEACSDTGGGQDMGYIGNGDWMAYPSFTVPTTGSYTLKYRVASANATGKFRLDANAGSYVIDDNITVPNTGGWQNWYTITHTVTINAGTYNLGLYAYTGGFNINWFDLTQVKALSASPEASERPDVRLYPNPATDQVQVYLPDASETLIEIFNSTGKLISSKKINAEGENIVPFDVSTWGIGVYILRVTSANKTSTFKFLKI